mgnify:CR=1 FL=1
MTYTSQSYNYDTLYSSSRTVFNAIMNHFHVITRPNRTQVGGTGSIINLRRALGENRGKDVEHFASTARHETGAIASTL